MRPLWLIAGSVDIKGCKLCIALRLERSGQNAFLPAATSMFILLIRHLVEVVSSLLAHTCHDPGKGSGLVQVVREKTQVRKVLKRPKEFSKYS